MPPPAVDLIDSRLLDILQKDNRVSVGELCDTVGLTPATCHRRLKRLRESGLIVREAALVDPKYTARPLTVIIELTLDTLGGAGRVTFEKKLAGMAELSMVWAVSGEADFIAIGHFRDIEHYRQFSIDELLGGAIVKRQKSSLAVDQLRFDLALDFAPVR